MAILTSGMAALMFAMTEAVSLRGALATRQSQRPGLPRCARNDTGESDCRAVLAMTVGGADYQGKVFFNADSPMLSTPRSSSTVVSQSGSISGTEDSNRSV